MSDPLKSYRDAYYDHSKNASAAARTLALSGLAVIWIFRATTDTGPTLPKEFFWPTLLIVVSLAFDLLQYVFSALIWGWFARSKEKQRLKSDAEVTANPKLNWPGLFFFWTKLIAITAAYFFLLKFLLHRLFPDWG